MFFEKISFLDDDNTSKMLFDVENGLVYGNMFKDEYMGYKDYKPVKLSASDDKSNMLLSIYQYDFAMNDLSLYLDLHPEDKVVYSIFKEYTNKLNYLIETFESIYGPLEIDDSNYESYMWSKGNWPFDGGNSNV